MASSEHSDDRAPELNRRRLLAGLAASGVAATAGCFGGEQEEADPDEARGTVQVDLDEVEEGGRINFPLTSPSIGNYDQAASTTASDGTVFAAVYDGLRVTTRTGENLNWMANSFEVAEAQDITAPDDYTEYMTEYEIATISEGSAAFDLSDTNVRLATHPDDVEALANGELGEGDTMRLLTRNEAPDAVDDGTYGTKLEISVHEGITFHNDEELTASNIVNSYDRFVGGALEPQQFDSFLHARPTDGMDDYGVEIYSVEPDAEADTAIQPLFIFPSEQMDVPNGDLDPRGGGPVPIGTGPYEVEEFEEGRQLLLSRTDNYWLEDVGLENKEWWNGPDEFPEKPVVDEINIRFQPQPSTRTAAIQEGSIDVAYGLPPEDNTTFQQSEDFSDFRVNAADATGYVFMQMPVVDGPLGDARVRRAVSEMIPRDQIVETLEDGWSSPAQLPFPEPSQGPAVEGTYQDAIERVDWTYPTEPQPDRAESLVNEAGVDTPISLTLETNANNTTRQRKLELTAEQLDETEVFDNTEVELPADLFTWITQTLYRDPEGDYAERNATATVGLTGGFDPDGYARGIYHPGSYGGCCNFFHPEDTFEFIDAIDKARFGVEPATDVGFRQETYENEVWPALVESAGNTIIDYSLNVVISRPKVKGYNAYPDPRNFLTYSLYAPYEPEGALLAYVDSDVADN